MKNAKWDDLEVFNPGPSSEPLKKVYKYDYFIFRKTDDIIEIIGKVQKTLSTESHKPKISEVIKVLIKRGFDSFEKED